MRPLRAIAVCVIAATGYAPHAAAQEPVLSDADNPTQRTSYQGPCHNGESWSGGKLVSEASAFTGIATFGYCEAQEYTLALYCSAGSPQLVLNVEMMVTGAGDGERAEAVVLVDEEPYELAGIMTFSDVLDGAQPALEVTRDGGLIDALKAGNKAMLLVGPEILDIHLRGSAKAIDAMLAACMP